MKQLLTKMMLKKAILIAAALSIAGPASALNILLTNDDGYGNNAVKTALEAAGHTVYVSTPATDQSGKSGAINTASGQAVTFTTKKNGTDLFFEINKAV